jgi:hypothetical protein
VLRYDRATITAMERARFHTLQGKGSGEAVFAFTRAT